MSDFMPKTVFLAAITLQYFLKQEIMKFSGLVFFLEFTVATPVLSWFHLINDIRFVKNTISILMGITLTNQITTYS